MKTTNEILEMVEQYKEADGLEYHIWEEDEMEDTENE